MLPTANAYTSAAIEPSYLDPKSAPSMLTADFVGHVKGKLGSLVGEIAQRNTQIQTNDSYVYGDYLQRSLRVPPGHDFTPVNWLRRVCEIHRTQTIGDGFTVSSSYHGIDVDAAFDPNEKPQLTLQNNKMKDYAESRNKLFQSILRDNGGDSLFANMAENGSAVGFSVLKAWYDKDEGKYCLHMVEAVENFYAVWSSNDFRKASFHAYVYQVDKQTAIKDYDANQNVATSPLGMPLVPPTAVGVSQYYSTQPMVTIMEITGKVEGWCVDGNGTLTKCAIGSETEMNCFIVGNDIKQIITDKRYLPKYYVFPNKLARRRPWGQPDISSSAIAINQSYIETLSDWRTVQSKVNFPKFKAFGFGQDIQLPKPKPRTVEIIGLGENQDIQPLQNPNSDANTELDFQRTMAELKEAFVRETGISQQLFDIPDSASTNSAQAGMLAMKSISDQVEARRQLWSPVIEKMFYDALDCLALWDDNIKDLIQDDTDWYIRVQWPPAMRQDDPNFQMMLLNRINAGLMSVQSFFEAMGINAKEEIDRMSDEMDNPITAAMHGKLLSMLAEFKIAGPPTSAPPKVAISLRGDLTPEQESNLASQHEFGDGPNFGPSSGPQGELGIRATDDAVNTGKITGQPYNTGNPVIQGGQPVPGGPAAAAGGSSPQAPSMITPPSNNQPGQQPVSQPGSGATSNGPQGNINQTAQRRGRK